MKEKETFESALEKLEKIIKELENGEIDLDKSISEYEKAMKLIKFCNTKLNEAEESVNKIMEDDKEKDFKPED